MSSRRCWVPRAPTASGNNAIPLPRCVDIFYFHVTAGVIAIAFQQEINAVAFVAIYHFRAYAVVALEFGHQTLFYSLPYQPVGKRGVNAYQYFGGGFYDLP